MRGNYTYVGAGGAGDSVGVVLLVFDKEIRDSYKFTVLIRLHLPRIRCRGGWMTLTIGM